MDCLDRRTCLERLAARMRREYIPDVIAENLPEDSLRYAYVTDDEEYWQELEREAQRLFRVFHGAPGSAVPPGRGADRTAPHEIAVELEEYTLKRARVFADVAATLAHNHPGVQRFRRRYLGGRRLSHEEASEFLDSLGGALFINYEAQDESTVAKNLRRLATRLSKIYRWRESDGVWFVLTGHAPPVRPVEARVSVSPPISRRARSYYPSSARITIEADAWVLPEEVERAFRSTQRQVLGGDTKRVADRTLAVASFVAGRLRTHPSESWRERWLAWNRACRAQWRYGDYRTLREAFVNFVYRRYQVLRFERRENTPYEEYRDRWWNRR